MASPPLAPAGLDVDVGQSAGLFAVWETSQRDGELRIMKACTAIRRPMPSLGVSSPRLRPLSSGRFFAWGLDDEADRSKCWRSATTKVWLFDAVKL
jgi:hypothetical protein